MKKIRCVLLLLLAIGVFSPLTVWAMPDVKIAIKAEKEVIIMEKGEKIKKIVEAKDIAPGEIVFYRLTYTNVGNEAANDIAITDPIPTGTIFIPGSATETGEITFSIDGGKTFKKPSLLTYEVKASGGKVEKLIATPELYTHIRWTITNIAPKEKNEVSFKVKVK